MVSALFPTFFLPEARVNIVNLLYEIGHGESERLLFSSVSVQAQIHARRLRPIWVLRDGRISFQLRFHLSEVHDGREIFLEAAFLREDQTFCPGASEMIHGHQVVEEM